MATTAKAPILPGFVPKSVKREHPAIAARKSIFDDVVAGPTDKAILLAIADRLEHRGSGEPETPRMSIAEIARRSGAGHASVERVINWYCWCGYLWRISGKSDRARNVYGFDLRAIPGPYARRRSARFKTPPRARGASLTEIGTSLTVRDATVDQTRDRNIDTEKEIRSGGASPQGATTERPVDTGTAPACERCTVRPALPAHGWCSKCAAIVSARVAAHAAPALETCARARGRPRRRLGAGYDEVGSRWR